MANPGRPPKRVRKEAKHRAVAKATRRRLATHRTPSDHFDDPDDPRCGDPTCPECYPENVVLQTATPAAATVVSSAGTAWAQHRAMERIQAQIGRFLRANNFASVDEANAALESLLLPDTGLDLPEAAPETDLERAQDVMFRAWEQRNRKKRVTLARQALSISPDCADAYVLLAEETARTADAARPLYEQAVAAAERALGPDRLEEDAGHFWGILDTRPYMRARAGLAEAFWATGDAVAAIAHFQDLLRLNPGDNQGLRYRLAAALFETKRHEELAQLFKRYPDDWSAAWLYGRALLEFRRRGDKPQARRALERALDYNPHVIAYLLGIRLLPRARPEYVGVGDENEAQDYVWSFATAWDETTGGFEWLANTTEAMIQETLPSRAIDSRRKP